MRHSLSQRSPPTMSPATSLLLLALIGHVLSDLGFLVLHTNDMHGRFQQADAHLGMCENDTSPQCYGGFARIHYEVQQQKRKAKDNGLESIFINAGDTFQGTPFYTIFKWPMVSKFLDMLELDVMSLGNHEFDEGVAELSSFLRNVSVPTVTCNLDISEEPSMNQPRLTPSYVLTVGGTKVGVIGYLTPQTKTLSDTGKVKFLDEIPSIRAEARKLIAQNVSILIALGHSGYSVDQEIARQVEEIDLVVGGHSHTFLYTGIPPDNDVALGPYPTVVTQPSGKKVPVVQAFYGTKYLGYLEVYFDDLGNLKNFNGSPILLSGNLPQDPVILEALKPYEDNISSVVRHIVGETCVVLDARNMSCKLGECNIGNLMTDAYVDSAAKMAGHSLGWTRAAVGLSQAGGIRDSFNPHTNIYRNGSIAMGDVITICPWENSIVVLNITGQTLAKALEHGVAKYEETITGHVSEFLQVSGLHVVYDMSKPSGHRLVSVTILCAECDVPTYRPLQPLAYYGVAMPSYMALGGDGFEMFTNITEHVKIADTDYMLLANYIEQHSPIHPAIEGRITILKSSAPSRNSYTIMPILALGLAVFHRVIRHIFSV